MSMPLSPRSALVNPPIFDNRSIHHARLACVDTPTLYVKMGCPYCKAAIDYLDEHEVAYEMVDVRGNDALMSKLKEISGQRRTPTMVWDDDVLADFGIDELNEFLRDRRAASNS